MGVKLREIFKREPIDLKDLKGKIILVDAFNTLYQFLATIRAHDGSLLTDRKGNVTSHLIGLFSRTAKLMELSVKPCFVFDGKMPALKHVEVKKRRELKKIAQKKYEAALEVKDILMMKKFAARTMRLTPKMVDQSKELLKALGLPVVQAPAEGEAQAAFMAKKGDGWAVASQDYDALVDGSPRLIQNLSIQARKARPEIIHLKPNLKRLGITDDQLLAIAILTGTDYNPGGIKGIGPKKALKLVLKHKKIEDVLKAAQWDVKSGLHWEDIWNAFKKMPVTEKYDLKWRPFSKKKIEDLLIKQHDFSVERVNKTIERIRKVQEGTAQKGLGAYA